MDKSWLNMDFHWFSGFTHFKLAFWVDYPKITSITTKTLIKLRCGKGFQEILCNFFWISQSFLSFGCDCVWKLVRVRISAEIRLMCEVTLTIWNPACRQQNRGARGARRNSNFSCISDMLASGAEGPADVIGAHICTGYARCFFSCTLLFTAKFIDPGPNPSTIHRCRAGCSRWTWVPRATASRPRRLACRLLSSGDLWNVLTSLICISLGLLSPSEFWWMYAPCVQYHWDIRWVCCLGSPTSSLCTLCNLRSRWSSGRRPTASSSSVHHDCRLPRQCWSEWWRPVEQHCWGIRHLWSSSLVSR